MIFQNRAQAARFLAQRFGEFRGVNPLVLALPRGGVPIAKEIARSLGTIFDVLVVRKIGAPRQEELGIGAITEGGYHWIDPGAKAYFQADHAEVERIVERERAEVGRRVQAYRGERKLSVRDRTVILADDGLATGVTARVAITYLRSLGARDVILAVPVCAPRTADRLRGDGVKLVCLSEPENFFAVGEYYREFDQVTDAEVIRDLPAPPADEMAESRGFFLGESGLKLSALLAVPRHATGFVVFAHGSGSGRFSARNQQVARTLNRDGFGTLLFDLLTPEESLDRGNAFDIPLLAARVGIALRWLADRPEAKRLPIGLFGASTGGGAALWAAAAAGHRVAAVVSRGGRPDLAFARLREVTAPTLLIVGEKDTAVIELNKLAERELRDVKLSIVPGATHLFEEPGTIEVVAGRASQWFRKHFVTREKRASA